VLTAVFERTAYVLLAAQFRAGDGKNARARVKLSGREALVQGRYELAHGQIAGATEQYQFKRI
jgi:hypothetical protein